MVRQRFIRTKGVGDSKCCFLEIQANDIGTPAFFFSATETCEALVTAELDIRPTCARRRQCWVLERKRAGFIGQVTLRETRSWCPGWCFLRCEANSGGDINLTLLGTRV